MSRRASNWRETLRLGRTGFLIADILIVSLSITLAYWLRFDGRIPEPHFTTMLFSIPLAVCAKVPVLMLLRMYRFSWRHVGIREVLGAIIACNIGSAALAAAFLLMREVVVYASVPRSVLAIDYALCLIGISGVRLSNRLWALIWERPRTRGRAKGKRALIVGAGDAGTSLVRSLVEEGASQYLPVGFLDDDRGKWGLIIHGVRVVGGRRQLRTAAETHRAEAVLIAVPSTEGPFVGDTVSRAREAGISDVRILPPLSQLYSSEVHVKELREVTPEDLLYRQRVSIDTKAIEQLVRDRSVLVTGAAGSIGSELCRQALRFRVGHLVCLDNDETGLFYLEKDLEERFHGRSISYCIGDIRDRRRIVEVLRAEKPSILFHAAAYKHVHVMERDPAEAVKTNVFGTECVVDEACKHGAEAVVMISTDKAVDPCSVMGVTKRVAELITHSYNGRTVTRCMAVRFGNVLGSRGSVLPIFEEQIRRGGPVTITDPEMSRYFMVTSEAVLLVLEAAAMGQGGEVFVLDMGEPVSILELAKDLIRSHGLEPDQDIPIVFTGARPGERLCEELLTAEEGTDSTTHEKIFIARLGSQWATEELAEQLERLRGPAEGGQRDRIVETLCALVPSYTPCETADAP